MTNSNKIEAQAYYTNANSPENTGAINTTMMTATILGPNGVLFEIANLSMLSISSSRQKFPVTNLGYVAPRGYTRGHRIYAGNMVFTAFERSAFTNLMNRLEPGQGFGNKADLIGKIVKPSTAFWDMKADELPPFDVHIVYPTTDGSYSYEMIEGIEIMDFGSIRSTQLLELSESYSFVAQDWTPIQKVALATGNTFKMTATGYPS